MIKHWIWQISVGSVLAAATLFTLTGCNSGDKTAVKEPEGGIANKNEPTSGKKLVVGIVFDSGGRGDKSFNDSAYAGIERATKELGIESQSIESKSEKDYEGNLTAMAEKGCDIVFAIGLNQTKALEKVAPQYKDIKFAIIDGSVTAPNVRCLKFKEEEGSLLVGYLAGLMSKTKKLGFVGGMEIDLIKKFYYGYCAGAKLADKTIEILPPNYTGDWDNVDKAKASSGLLFNSGADVVYAAAGRAGLGVIRAAKDSGKFAIGVDSDQDYLAEGSVLTSMVKRVDEAVFKTISDVKDSKFTSGDVIYDLKANGVGISELKFTKDLIGAANLAKVEAVKTRVTSGALSAPADEAAYKAFIAANAQ